MNQLKKINRKDIEDIIALTPMQEGMLFHYLKDPGSDYYFEQLCLTITGEIDLNRFKQAWDFVVETNEMLRTVFRWEKLEKPVQIILKHHSIKPVYYDFSSEEIKANDRDKAFDLLEVPFRVTLCKIEEKRYEMIISNHHILYDGWSNGIILKEFFKAYEELRKKKTFIPLVKTKFKEFVAFIKNQDIKDQEIFWKGYLEGFITPSHLPVKMKNVNEKTGCDVKRIIGYRIEFTENVKDNIHHFVKKHKITFASLFYCAWGILLQKYSNSEDVVFGTTVSGRSAGIRGIEDIVGLFINTLPLRVRTCAGETITDMLYRTKNTLRIREEYEGTSLVRIKEWSDVNQENGLFDSILVIENYPLEESLAEVESSLAVNSYSMHEKTNFDLAVFIKLTEMQFNYNEAVFEKKTVEKLARHFMCVLEGIIHNPDRDIYRLEILSEEDKRQIWAETGATGEAYPGGKTIDNLNDEISFDF
jgi:hypothetical protein